MAVLVEQDPAPLRRAEAGEDVQGVVGVDGAVPGEFTGQVVDTEGGGESDAQFDPVERAEGLGGGRGSSAARGCGTVAAMAARMPLSSSPAKVPSSRPR